MNTFISILFLIFNSNNLTFKPATIQADTLKVYNYTDDHVIPSDEGFISVVIKLDINDNIILQWVETYPTSFKTKDDKIDNTNVFIKMKKRGTVEYEIVPIAFSPIPSPIGVHAKINITISGSLYEEYEFVAKVRNKKTYLMTLNGQRN